MTSTIKFSQFANTDPNVSTNKIVGVNTDFNGINIQGPLTTTWTTATRPMSPYDGLAGYNTTTESWEYYQQASASWLTFATGFAGETWTVETAVSVNAVVNAGYITNRAVTPVQILLPATFAFGDSIKVMGMGAGGWSIIANVGQEIVFGSSATSVQGSISSDIQYSNIEIRGMLPPTAWTTWSINSNPTLV